MSIVLWMRPRDWRSRQAAVPLVRRAALHLHCVTATFAVAVGPGLLLPPQLFHQRAGPACSTGFARIRARRLSHCARMAGCIRRTRVAAPTTALLRITGRVASSEVHESRHIQCVQLKSTQRAPVRDPTLPTPNSAPVGTSTCAPRPGQGSGSPSSFGVLHAAAVLERTKHGRGGRRRPGCVSLLARRCRRPLGIGSTAPRAPARGRWFPRLRHGAAATVPHLRWTRGAPSTRLRTYRLQVLSPRAGHSWPAKQRVRAVLAQAPALRFRCCCRCRCRSRPANAPSAPGRVGLLRKRHPRLRQCRPDLASSLPQCLALIVTEWGALCVWPLGCAVPQLPNAHLQVRQLTLRLLEAAIRRGS